MQIKAALTPHKRGVYITFTPGCRVSLLEGEHGYEPARPKMSLGQKAEFASASAGLTNKALLDALEPIAQELVEAGLRAEDVITIIDAVMLMRSTLRGRALEYMDDVQMARVYSMMGDPLEPPSAPSFNFDDVMRGF